MTDRNEGVESSDRQLRRDLGLQQLFFLSFGSIIGSGWLFATLSAGAVAGPASLISWVIAAVLVIIIALNYAEVATMMPRSGGVVRYPHLTHGGYVGFVVSWSLLLSVVSTTAIEALAVVTYASGYIKSWVGLDLTASVGGVTLLTAPGIILAILLMVFFFLVNVFGVKFFGEFNRWASWWKTIIPILTFVFLLFAFNASNFTSYGGFVPEGYDNMFNAIAVGGIIFSFLGFRQGLNFGGEARNPQRDILAATILSALAAGVIYFMLQLAFLGALDWQSAGVEPGNWGALQGSDWGDQPLYSAFTSAGLAGLGAFGVLLLIDAAVSPAGTGWIYMGEGSRIFYGMAMQDDMPHVFRRISGRYRIPWVGLVATLVVGCIFFAPFPSWYKLVGFITSTTVLTFVMGALQLQVMRRTAPDLSRPFWLRGASVISPLGFVAASMIVYWSGFGTLRGVVAAVLIGLPIYTLSQAPRRGKMSFAKGLAVGVPFAAIWVATQYFGPMGQDALPFWLFWILSVAEVLAFTALVWFLSNDEGRREVNAAWWLLFLTLALYGLSYYGTYGPEGVDPLVPFPWDNFVAVALGLIAYYWGVSSGYQTQEMKRIADSGTGIIEDVEPDIKESSASEAADTR